MERPQDLRRTLTEGGMWTTWLLKTTESVEKVKSEDYLNNVYKTLLEEDELIIRIKNKTENFRLHLLIRKIDSDVAKVHTQVIHELDLSTGEDIVMIEEQEAEA